MTPKERFFAALEFKSPDKPALEYYYTDVGYAEHGERLIRLYERYPGDTAPFIPTDPASLPKPDPADFLPDGSYFKRTTDTWGTVWEYRIFGRIGHAVEFPLDDLESAADYQFPEHPLLNSQTSREFTSYKEKYGAHYPIRYSVPGMFEKLIALRSFEDVLADLASEEPLLYAFTERLCEYIIEEIRLAASHGADIIFMGDDYGTEQSLLISPALWRSFFKPFLKRVGDEVKSHGMKLCFHSCGQVWDIMPDLKEIGADSIWPQLPLYDYGKLSARLRELKLALCMHIDRGELMQHGTKEQVKAEVKRLYEAFRPDLGGAWFYFEADQGFPYSNLEALAEGIAEFRM